LFASDRLGGADAGMSNLARATSRRAEPVDSDRHETALHEHDNKQCREKPGGHRHAEDGDGARPKVSQRVGN